MFIPFNIKNTATFNLIYANYNTINKKNELCFKSSFFVCAKKIFTQYNLDDKLKLHN